MTFLLRPILIFPFINKCWIKYSFKEWEDKI